MNNPPKIYILSPHFDDAAYGLTITISKLLNRKVPVTLINCFTITKWTALPVTDKDVKSVSLLRAMEDVEYNKLFNSAIKIINLDLLDAPLRNGYIFQNQPFQQNELQLVDELGKLLEQHVVGGILLCPLAIGNHIDHAICREAVIKLYKKFSVIFFEDLPYAQRIGEDQVRRHIKDLEEKLDVKLKSYTCGLQNCTIDKGHAIKVYKSQLNEEIHSEILSRMNAMEGERLWSEDLEIERWATLLEND
ncbi:PIG-L deacetylase family protein [Segetibacter koreensis]|uniref:PIG-L deacetylase family protein n=1 Tax=Segetibacter koreensis TaxID=398037 RepID=UPI00036B0D02|nr:PIG-L family deacetylase [Segetibacter koreensis]